MSFMQSLKLETQPNFRSVLASPRIRNSNSISNTAAYPFIKLSVKCKLTRSNAQQRCFQINKTGELSRK